MTTEQREICVSIARQIPADVSLEALHLGFLSHHIRTATMVSMGFVELILDTVEPECLDQVLWQGNDRGGPRSLREALDRIFVSQERMVLALEKLERDWE